MIHKSPLGAAVSARDEPGRKDQIRRKRGAGLFEADIGLRSHRLHAMPTHPLVSIAVRQMRLTDLKGNDWRESLSMPLTDNQLIIVLIIYSSPRRPLALYSFSCVTKTARGERLPNGLAGSRLW